MSVPIFRYPNSNQKEKIALKIVSKGLMASQPRKLLEKIIDKKGGVLKIDGAEIDPKKNNLYILGWGKASSAMAQAVETIMGPSQIKDGVVVSNNLFPLKKIVNLKGSHPYPTRKNLVAAKKICSFIKRFRKNDIVLCLISGGGSALFSLPVKEVGLKDYNTTTKLMLKRGMEDFEINYVRKHLSQIKGGKLAALIHPARIINLIISDDPANIINAIASGPTVSDSSTFRDSYNVLKKYRLINTVPISVKNYLKKNIHSKKNETVKNSYIFKNVKTRIILDNKITLHNIRSVAENNSFKTFIYPKVFTKNVSTSVLQLKKFVDRKLITLGKKNFVILAGGEIPINVKKSGKGGRCQHFAAMMIPYIKNCPNSIFLSIASDGQDYIKGISGAMINNETALSCSKKEIDLSKYITDTNTYELHKKLRTHIRTARSTGLNVSDIYMFVHFK